ncbi:helix-turn-helix domain-containing protein [Streptomyces aureocirculatus]|uniref:helix-turn-helix domain-containing protein n=1 Tax=Streptomyces aureocirculatus TaxID=67275 RepID=UPI0004C9BA0F|nr:helix-turn-helix transcriptional regulator [Streptomyces aureocirculatus]
MSAPRPAPTVGQMVLGRRLLGYRETAGLTALQASKAVHVSLTTVTRMEKAETPLKWATVKALLELYDVEAQETEEFLQLTVKANEPGWWQSFSDVLPNWFSIHVSLETAATQLRIYEPHVVPGLLQTRQYAEAVLRAGLPRMTPDVLDRHVTLRMKRQEILTRTRPARPPKVWVVMDETCLRRPVGDRSVMAGQIDRLLEVADLPNLTLQVCPLEAGLHPGAFGPFHIFRFAVPELPDVVSTDMLSGAKYTEDEDAAGLFREALDHMSSVHALDRESTKDFLADARKELP